jgi:hypothetical protein
MRSRGDQIDSTREKPIPCEDRMDLGKVDPGHVRLPPNPDAGLSSDEKARVVKILLSRS